MPDNRTNKQDHGEEAKERIEEAGRVLEAALSSRDKDKSLFITAFAVIATLSLKLKQCLSAETAREQGNVITGRPHRRKVTKQAKKREKSLAIDPASPPSS